MLNLRQILLALADLYELEATEHGGRSLARVATIVVNRGAFFERLKIGKTCTLTSFEVFIGWFANAENWPTKSIPVDAAALINSFPVEHHLPAEAE